MLGPQAPPFPPMCLTTVCCALLTCAAADIIFVSVNTPTKTSGIGAGKAADLSYWESAARLIANACKGKAFKVVVEKSTVPVKTAEAISKVRWAVGSSGSRRAGCAR